MANSKANPGLMSVWIMAARPKTLILGISPILVATLLAVETGDPVSWLVFAAILASAMGIQIATNFWNDAADAASGLDTKEERLGPPRVTSLGLLDGKIVRRASYISLLIAALCGLFLVLQGGWPILAIGLVGILCAFGYSSGPYPISGSPFGEIFVVIFFGIMSVMGSYYLLTDLWTVKSFWAGFYIGLPAAAVLTVNNHRDRVGDKKNGRRTLAIQVGPRATKRLYAIFLLVSCIGLIHVFSFIQHGTLSLISLIVSMLLMLVAVFGPIRKLFMAETAPALNKCLAITSLFQLAWVLAFFIIQFLT